MPATGATDGLRVSIRHTGGTPRLPGVTVTADTAGVATGALTPASAATLGAALVREARAVATGRTTGVFTGVTSIGAARATTPVTPSFVMHTLVIKGLDDRGAPAVGAFGLLLDVVDGRRYTGFVFIRRGEARVSLPSGVYSGAFSFDRQQGDGTWSTQLVPRPVTGGEVDLTYARTDDRGFASISVGSSAPPDGGLLVAPVSAPTRGTQSVTTAFHLEGPAAAAYAYDLSFTGSFFLFVSLRPLGVPVTRTSYVYGTDVVG
ncbi:MAG: hypothetical protein M3Y71_01565 [Actinomycetota bacterium]|nr:hypothetical protein [Actinomycetota bacterium]